jgi:hypothetical protein
VKLSAKSQTVVSQAALPHAERIQKYTQQIYIY